METRPEALSENHGDLGELKHVSRELLYELVWHEPMTKVAARFEVSGSFMARVCSDLNVPRPDRGYWAKLAVGKKVVKPPLLPQQPGHPIEWSRTGYGAKTARGTPTPPQSRRLHRMTSTQLDRAHPLIDGAKSHFQKGRQTDIGFLKPSKYLLPDLFVTEDRLEYALGVANKLYKSLEAEGYTVTIAPRDSVFRRASYDEREKGGQKRHYYDHWAPQRPTVVYVGTVVIGINIFEMTENVEVYSDNGKYFRVKDAPPAKTKRHVVHRWTHNKDMPTGRLCIQLFSADGRTHWTQQWKEPTQGESEKLIASIRKAIRGIAVDVAKLVAEADIQSELREREWVLQRERDRIAELERRVKKAHADAKEELASIMAEWGNAKKISDFFAEALRACEQLDGAQREAAIKRIETAKAAYPVPNSLQMLLLWKTPNERLSRKPEDGEFGGWG